ncbi:MAG: type II secretion system minor pseudopilin GspJ [Hydrogenovibrio sp.]|nr:type II secretion system minor pseudopilin GspJ [Hydrogenovibrio sp.]
MIHPSSAKQQGFTLIELLIAISISAVIAVLAYQSIYQATTVQDMTDDKIHDLDSLQRALWWMEQDFTQLAPRPIIDQQQRTLPALMLTQGQRIELSRIAIYPSPYAVAGLSRVGYYLQGQTLYRVVWPVIDRAPDTQPRTIAILNHVTAFGIRVLNHEKRWQLIWPDEKQTLDALPEMIEVVITIEGQGTVKRLFPGINNFDDGATKQ